MEKTVNFSLNKPEAGDLLRVDDFNENAEIIDAVLGSLNTAVVTKGNCNIITGTYAGTGTYGANNPITLTCDFTPRLLLIREDRGMTYFNLTAVKGQSVVTVYASFTDSTRQGPVYLTWGEDSVTWYGTKEDGFYNMNGAGRTYYYLVIG